jgi:ribosomal protein L16/L10AE
VIKPGQIIFEISGLPKEACIECFNRVAHKLPFKCRMVGRLDTF